MDCIEWTKAKDKSGYGVSWLNGRWIRAHQKAYIQKNGQIPAGLVVRHTCDNRSCVNPDHLVLGTHKQNSQDMVERNRQAKGSGIGTSVLTEELVLWIRESTQSSSKVAFALNVSATTVKDVRKNKIWRHVVN